MSPASGAVCLNGGDFIAGACQCYGGWTGSNCELPAIPVGWNIVPPTSCSGLPLQSNDMPLQSTWLRMQLSAEDNIYTFKPFASSGLEILKDITIGLDTPYIYSGNVLLSGPPGAGNTLTGQAILPGWIAFSGNSFVLRASLLTQMSLGSGNIGRRRLLATSKSQLRSDERQAADLFSKDHNYPTGASSMVMLASAIRIDLPTGFTMGTIDKRYCEYEGNLPELTNLALYFATGTLTDTQIGVLQDGGLGGLTIRAGITLVAQYYISPCTLPGLSNYFSAATVLFSATVLLPPEFGITMTAQAALAFPSGSTIIGAAASITTTIEATVEEETTEEELQESMANDPSAGVAFSMKTLSAKVGSSVTKKPTSAPVVRSSKSSYATTKGVAAAAAAAAAISIGARFVPSITRCAGLKTSVETKGKIGVKVGGSQIDFYATTYAGIQTCPTPAAPLRI